MIPADFLLIDLGNTSAKLRLARASGLIGQTRRLPTAALLAPGGASALKEMLGDWRYGRAVLSSVVPGAARVVAAVWPDLLTIHAGLDTGVDLRLYPGAKTLGADRLANLAGALARHGPGPLIVVDLGTAATFNVLDARGRFLGGAIAPGWAAVSGYLSARTALLPPVNFAGAVPRAIGHNTAGAIRAGTILGYRGLVREIVAGLRGGVGRGRTRDRDRRRRALPGRADRAAARHRGPRPDAPRPARHRGASGGPRKLKPLSGRTCRRDWRMAPPVDPAEVGARRTGRRVCSLPGRLVRRRNR